MRNGETVEIEIDKGKRLIIKLETISEPDENGNRTIYYAMNGQARRIYIKDENVHTNANVKPKADKSNPSHIGAQMPGSVTEVKVSVGESVKANQPLLITEAMKMETTIQAPFDGVIKQVTVNNGDTIATGDLLIEIEKQLTKMIKIKRDYTTIDVISFLHGLGLILNIDINRNFNGRAIKITVCFLLLLVTSSIVTLA